MSILSARRILFLIALILINGSAGYAALMKANAPPNLPPPDQEYALPSDHLNILTAFALQNLKTLPNRQLNLKVPYEDINTFRQHLIVASAQEGWYTYNRQHLVLPAQDLPALADLEQDPIGWVTARSTAVHNPKPPTDLDLRKVTFHILPEGALSRHDWRSIGILFLIFTFIGGLLLILPFLIREPNNPTPPRNPSVSPTT